MLSPEYYDALTDDLIRLYSDLDNAVIADITRRILKTGDMTETAKWQAKQLQESGLLYDDILSEIAKRTDATENQVRTLFEDAGVKSVPPNVNRRHSELLFRKSKTLNLNRSCRTALIMQMTL